MKSALFTLGLILITCTAFSQNHYNIPNVANPNLPNSYLRTNSFYENLQAEYLQKTTASYELKGAVKSIKERITVGPNIDLAKTIHYNFLANQKLLSYVEDTLDSFVNSNARIELYTYNNSAQKLLQLVTYNGALSHNSKTTLYFDNEGTVYKEVFEKYQQDSWSAKDYEKYIFDYVKTYSWNESKGTVSWEYQYKIENSSYYRLQDGSRSFEWEKQPPTPSPFSLQQSIFSEIQQEYDSLGRILKHYNFDLTIKGSYNIDFLVEFTYNERNELSEIKNYMRGPQPEFELYEHCKIEYLAYDAQGNWTEKKVERLNENPFNSSEVQEVYCYYREISYY